MRDGLCPTCGQVEPIWTPARILDAIRAHYEKHGSAPSQSAWSKGSYDHPSYMTVYYKFGSLGAAVDAAGVPRNLDQVRWTRQSAVQALFEWRVRHGRLPLLREWRLMAEGRPTYATVRKLFGGWNAFLEAAGYPVAKPWSKAAA